MFVENSRDRRTILQSAKGTALIGTQVLHTCRCFLPLNISQSAPLDLDLVLP
jgi:hypothetical protein